MTFKGCNVMSWIHYIVELYITLCRRDKSIRNVCFLLRLEVFVKWIIFLTQQKILSDFAYFREVRLKEIMGIKCSLRDLQLTSLMELTFRSLYDYNSRSQNYWDCIFLVYLFHIKCVCVCVLLLSSLLYNVHVVVRGRLARISSPAIIWFWIIKSD